MTVIETSVWIDSFRGVLNPQTAWLNEHMDREEIALTDLVFFETLRGFSDTSQFKQASGYMSRFSILDTGGAVVAAKAAEYHQVLRKRGITVRSGIDCVIATYCIREGHSLLHNDRDFEPFEKHLGLRVIHP